jgi:hypothetical protein
MWAARVEDTVERNSLHMTFRGWTYTLEDYVLALHDAGLCIEVIREPTPSSDTRYELLQATRTAARRSTNHRASPCDAHRHPHPPNDRPPPPLARWQPEPPTRLR